MKCFIVTAVFHPEPLVSARTSEDIARALSNRGDEVEVAAPYPSRPSASLYPQAAQGLFSRTKLDPRVTLVRCVSCFAPRSTMRERFLENLSFGLSSGLLLLFTERPNVIYANTWPIFAAAIVTLVARMRQIPIVISVQDVYPESLLSQGRLGAQSKLAAVMHSIDEWIALRAAALIVISERFASIYRDHRRVPPSKVHVIPNWGEAAPIPTREEGLALRHEIGIPGDAFVCAYGGNIGTAANVEGVIEALETMREEDRPYLLIAGAGSQLDSCRALAQRVDPERIRFYTPWPAEKTLAVYGAADMLVLPTRGSQSLASMPSKLVSYMISARPVIAQALPDSELAAIVERSGCGWVVPPGDPVALAITLRMGAKATAEGERRGRAGRSYALANFTPEYSIPRVLDLLDQAAAGAVGRQSKSGMSQ